MTDPVSFEDDKRLAAIGEELGRDGKRLIFHRGAEGRWLCFPSAVTEAQAPSARGLPEFTGATQLEVAEKALAAHRADRAAGR